MNMNETKQKELIEKLNFLGVQDFFIKNTAMVRPLKGKSIQEYNLYIIELNQISESNTLPNLVFEFRFNKYKQGLDAIDIMNFMQLPYRDISTYGNEHRVGENHFSGEDPFTKMYGLDEAIKIISASWRSAIKNPKIRNLYEDDLNKISGAIDLLQIHEDEIIKQCKIEKKIKIFNENFKVNKNIFISFDSIHYKFIISLILYYYHVTENSDERENLKTVDFESLLKLDKTKIAISYLSNFPENILNEIVSNKYFLRGRTAKEVFNRQSLFTALYILLSSWNSFTDEDIKFIKKEINPNINTKIPFNEIVEGSIARHEFPNWKFSNKEIYTLMIDFLSTYQETNYQKWLDYKLNKLKKDGKFADQKIDLENSRPSFDPRDLLVAFSNIKRQGYLRNSVDTDNYQLTEEGHQLLNLNG